MVILIQAVVKLLNYADRPYLLLFLFACFNVLSLPAHSLVSEITLSYNYLKRTFDDLNWFANQAITGSVSFYLGDRTAVELGYTQGLFVRKELENALNNSQAQRTSTQKTDSYDCSVIFLFSDRRAAWQPFLRLGASYIKREQQVQIDNDIPFYIVPEDAIAPSLGFGFRLVLSDKFNLRFGVDSIQTPIGNNKYVYDFSTRAGLSILVY